MKMLILLALISTSLFSADKRPFKDLSPQEQHDRCLETARGLAIQREVWIEEGTASPTPNRPFTREGAEETFEPQIQHWVKSGKLKESEIYENFMERLKTRLATLDEQRATKKGLTIDQYRTQIATRRAKFLIDAEASLKVRETAQQITRGN